MSSETKNWPKCYPVIYHDIQADILEADAIRLTERSYKLWLYYIVTLVFNLVAVIAYAIQAPVLSGGNSAIQIILAIIYLAIWPLIDFFSRHYNLYRGFKHQSQNHFRAFFFMTFFEILFGVFIGIGFFHGGGGGLIAMIDNFKADPPRLVAGVFSAICVFFVLTLTTFHFILFKQVYSHFKMQGWSLIPGRGRSEK